MMTGEKAGGAVVPTRGSLLVGVALLLLPFGIFGWMLPFVGGLTLGNDYGAFSTQEQMELQFSLHHGTFPLYVPGFAGGRSAAALPLGQVYHPFSHLLSRMPGYWEGLALDWNTAGRLLSLGVAQLLLYALLRVLGTGGVPAFVLSLMTVYNQRMLDQFRYGAGMENYTAFIFLFVALGFSWVRRQRARLPLAVAAATFLLATGGYPPFMYFGLLAAGALTPVLPFVLESIRGRERPSAGSVLRFYAVAALGVSLGLAIAAPAVLGMVFEFAADSPLRSGRGYEWSLSYCDSPGGALASFFSPLDAAVSGAFGSSPLLLFAVLVPPLVVAAALAGSVAAREGSVTTRTGPLGMWELGAAGLLWLEAALFWAVSLGDATPLHRIYWETVPLASAARIPGRVTLVLPVALMLLLAWLLARAGRPGVKTLTAAGGVLAAFSLLHLYVLPLFPPRGPYVPSQIQPHRWWVDTVLVVAGGLSIVLAGFMAAAGPERRGRRVRLSTGAALCCVVVLQVALQMRWGTWVAEAVPSWTWREMAESKQEELTYRGLAGAGMESGAVLAQIERSCLAWELARFFRCWRGAGGSDDAYGALATGPNAGIAVIEGEKGGPAGGEGACGSDLPEDVVTLDYGSTNLLRLAVEAGGGGWLVFSYPFSERWRAYLDGEETETRRANGYALAMPVPAGRHVAEIRYTSKATGRGMALACAVLALLGLTAGLGAPGRARPLVAVVSLALPLLLYLLWSGSLYGGESLGTRYRWTTAMFPPRDNVAYAKRTRASSVLHRQPATSHYPGLAVDGRRGTNFAATAPSDPSPWWEVDLGGEFSLGRLVLHGSNRVAQHLPVGVYLSSDGRTYRNVAVIGADADPFEARVELGGESGRFVRLRSSGRGVLAIGEVEVYPLPPGTAPPR